MNILKGYFSSLQNEGDVLSVKVDVLGVEFSVLMLDFSSFDFNGELELIFKEHELCFANLGANLSVENCFEARICRIKKGRILWHIFFQFKHFELGSLIDAKKGEKLDLKLGEKRLCFIKANDITLRKASV
ncbi:molybdenum-pterin-binding protein [Campylobacter upsaliensis]